MGQQYKICFFMAFIVLPSPTKLSAQEKLSTGTALIDSYLLNDQVKQADSELQSQIETFKKAKQIDSLAQYIEYVGQISLLKSNQNNAVKQAETFFENLKKLGASKRAQYIALHNLSYLYQDLGETQKAFEASQESLQTILSVNDATQNEIGEAYYVLTRSYYFAGKYVDATHQCKKSQYHFLKSKEKDYNRLSDVNNFFGVLMWRSQKLDSAQYYFEKSISSLQKADKDSIYKIYSAAGIQLNISQIMEARGKISEAQQTLEKVIKDCSFVIAESKEAATVEDSKRLLWIGISNLSTLYNNISNVNRAYELVNYIYHKRDQLYQDSDPEKSHSIVLLGQTQMSLKEFDKAIASFQKVLKIYDTDAGQDIFWQAIATGSLATCYEQKREVALAEKTYNEADKLYKSALGENLDDTYLDFAIDKAMFLAKNNKPEAAISTAINAYNYLKKNGGENNNDLISHMLNLAKVYYTVSDYPKSLEWSEKGISFIDKLSQNKTTSLNAVKLTYLKPLLILEHSQARYKQQSIKDSVFLKDLLKEMDNAFKILEDQKALISKDDNVNVLYSNFLGLYSFTKQLYSDLYIQTKNKKYLTKLIETHENSVYYGIRSHLMVQDEINFADVPQAIVQRESKLKKEAVDITYNTEDSTSSFQSYLGANDIYNTFLDSLKTAYPKYYKMKYATLDVSLQDLQKYIPENTTVIRYFFIDEVLYAMVLDKENRNLIKLNFNPVKNHIEYLNKPQPSLEEESALLFELYEKLWQPLESRIHTKKIIIVPDGALFNLSFETLTPSKIKSYNELATNSLLAQYNISYNFSLLLLNEDKKPKMFSNNFVAFAPGFNKEMKDDYKISITDSLDKDATYLTLLSQPSSVKLAEEYSKIFNGTSFLNENASKTIFQNKAGEHKIIHIGTHGESNNISPEFSRLIFAKTLDGPEDYDENSLYSYEIYNTDLSSNLAILTACETGKPTYQPGEGMISLAHAFNYAGSESILTSLWDIDEVSSSQIVGYFYDFLAEGLPKDEALKKAKLKYLSTVEGRGAAPQYWAGLVLIGDTAPIQLQQSLNPIWWWVPGFIFLTVFVILILKRKKNKKI